MFFQIVIQYLGYFCIQNLLQRTWKNHPIWSYWWRALLNFNVAIFFTSNLTLLAAGNPLNQMEGLNTNTAMDWDLEFRSSGYVRRLLFKRSLVKIPSPDTKWTFFTLFFVNFLLFVWKDRKLNEKEADDGSF